MGHIRHHSIVVTTYSLDAAKEARQVACFFFDRLMFGDIVSEIRESCINGYHSFAIFSFAIFPDGSNEGWDDSNRGDECRVQFRQWLREQETGDGDSAYSWVEVQFGDDGLSTEIVDDSERLIRQREYLDGATDVVGEKGW